MIPWLSLAITACAGSDPGADPLVVFAASSLTDAFAEIGGAFEREVPGARVVFAFAGSQALRLQIEKGAPADVFASADMRQLASLKALGLVADSRTFAHGELAIVQPASGTQDIRSLEESVRAERIVVGRPATPVGAYTDTLIQRAERKLGRRFGRAFRERIVSLEPSARMVRAKVEMGEADLGVIYKSDAQGKAGLRIVGMADDLQVRVAYDAGRVLDSKSPDLAERWLEFLASPTAKDILRIRGFAVE